MDRTATLVTAGLSAVVTLTAATAIAVNTGLLALPADDVAGTLDAATPVAATAQDPALQPVEVETVYVDVQEPPAGPAQRRVVVVRAPAAPPAAAADEPYGEEGEAYDDEEGEDHDEYEEEEHDEYEEEEHDEYEEEEEHEGADEDEHEYEGWDEDD